MHAVWYSFGTPLVHERQDSWPAWSWYFALRFRVFVFLLFCVSREICSDLQNWHPPFTRLAYSFVFNERSRRANVQTGVAIYGRAAISESKPINANGAVIWINGPLFGGITTRFTFSAGRGRSGTNRGGISTSITVDTRLLTYRVLVFSAGGLFLYLVVFGCRLEISVK